MTLGFYYHIPVYQEDNKIYLPTHFGLFIDELAKNSEKLIFFSFSSPSKLNEQKYYLKQDNIELIDMGRKPKFPYQVLFGTFYLNKLKKHINKCDRLLIRAPTPLAFSFYFKFSKSVLISYLIVGDYLEGIKYQNFSLWRQTLINFFTYLNEYFQNIAIKRSICIVNSIALKNKYEQLGVKVNMVKTTSLTSADFFKRIDTCQDANNIKLIFVGRIEKAKGMDEIIEAFIKLKKDNYPVTLHLAGENTSDAKKYFKKLDDLKFLSNDWSYHGFLEGNDLFKLYRTGDIFILPSYHEGFPRVLWEAMASSIPIISTKVGGIPYYLKDNDSALLIEAGSHTLLYESIVKLITDSELRIKLIENAFSLVQNNTVEIQVRKLINIVKS